ncbi:MAG: tRNA (adenosine(37)-N6)-threonylcarbamoyltransferase complex dimerization subunit type 1 TsaB [Rhodobacteraceae bacterium]|nr:tRNA (adenosine(37)-N6)-threonylcarbamoyltransferase complex dimerization subunit type 1 TsaB [Paracoccaceae bacterium]
MTAPVFPLVLGFDTAGPACLAALVRGDAVLAAREEPMATGQAERLMPMLAEVLAEAGIGWADLDRIGVGTGPGNFTGTRISVAAARGLALGLGVPAIGVDRFTALALGQPRPLAVVEDARRGEVYVQVMDTLGADAPLLIDPSDLPHAIGGAALTGSAATAAAAVTGGPVLSPLLPLAVAIARLAAAAPDGSPRPAPVYLRAADAAPPRSAPPAILP